MRRCLMTVALMLATATVNAQDIFDQGQNDEGPWSEIDHTTATVPQVPDGAIVIDGTVGASEYGGFEGRTVIPVTNAYVLNWPNDRQWDGVEDSSFTFYLAHDTNFLYVGVDALDDVVNSDDPNPQFWKDDSIEIIVDALNDDYDINTDQSMDAYGGHNYVNFEGRFSQWDDEANEISGDDWSTAVDYTYGGPEDADADIAAFGQETATGWSMEVRFHKRLFEDPEVGNKLVEGYRMGFNIGMDDDDRFGPGPEGDASRSQDLELQYWWANRERAVGWNEFEAENYTQEEIDSGAYLGDFDLLIDGNGRLTHGAAGDIIFGGFAGPVGDFDGDGALDVDDVNLLIDEMIAGGMGTQFDLNSDNAVNQLDLNVWVSDLKMTWMGDANLDGEFNSSDFVTVFTAGKFETDSDAGWDEGDWNGDGRFNSSDFVVAFTDGGFELGPKAAVASVPEPSTLTLLLLAAVFTRRLTRRDS